MKTYCIRRDANGDVRCEVEHGRLAYPLPHVIVHSPSGFEVGYGGSGPADLALSILADYFGEQPMHPHRRFTLKPGEWRCWFYH